MRFGGGGLCACALGCMNDKMDGKEGKTRLGVSSLEEGGAMMLRGWMGFEENEERNVYFGGVFLSLEQYGAMRIINIVLR